MNGLELTIAISAGTYFTNKILYYCCMAPAEISSNPGMMERIQDQGNALTTWFQEKLGPRTWSIISDVIIDNAWISLLVLGILSERSYPLPIDPFSKVLVLVACGITFCILAWATRAILTIITPHLSELFVNIVSPRNFRSNAHPDLDGVDHVFEAPLDPLAETNPYVPT